MPKHPAPEAVLARSASRNFHSQLEFYNRIVLPEMQQDAQYPSAFQMDSFVRSLAQRASIGDDANALLRNAGGGRPCRFYARTNVLAAGAVPDGIQLITAGIGARYKSTQDGREQIVSFLLPGDWVGIQTCLGVGFDHSVRAITLLESKHLSCGIVNDLLERASGAADALWKAMLLDEAIAREWLVNVGSRMGIERVAHLFCELFTRLNSVGLVVANRCMLPLRQADVAQAVALTPVHVNRVLMEIMRRGWMTFRQGVLEIHDFASLRDAAGFDARYLDHESFALLPCRARRDPFSNVQVAHN